MKYPGKITIVSGEIESGKTRFCTRLAEQNKQAGKDVAGIISPAVFDAGTKIAIDALDVRHGEQRRLAELTAPANSPQGPQTRRWQFSAATITWCNQVLLHATPCDLLIIDELGPLEFEQHAGMMAAFLSIDSRQFESAHIVVRPTLVDIARQRWKDAEVVIISNQADL